ncbi:MAG TPA: hypothetical protein VNS61_14765 [Caldimonas sp.]|nr:hypothetical protein [Caldimonas sp.]
MNISATSSVVAPLIPSQGFQPSQVDSTSDPDGGGHAHRAHGGGHMRQAVMQALQSLGLTPPQDASSSSASTSTGAGSDPSGSTSATTGVKQDMRQFMHALFEAVKSENASGGTASPGSSDPKASFADGLSSLISQVSNGTAPADLQSAFSKLASDLQPAAATTPATGSTSAAAGNAQATLQAFLTNLQQDLGYAGSNASAVGNLLTAQV